MSAFIDIANQRFGRLVAIKRIGRGPGNHVRWQCRCDCGNQIITTTNKLRNGHTGSCGCLKRDATIERQLVDITGQRYNSLIVLDYVGMSKGRSPRTLWRCRCDCGTEVTVQTDKLRTEERKSCGCLPHKAKHGHVRDRTFSPTYISWLGMRQRCDYPNHRNYKHYGGRGIKVCERWQGPDGFSNFLADMGERPEGLTLDRYPDNDGNYEPGNCRWATASEQARNRHRTKASPAVRGGTGSIAGSKL